MEQRRPLSPGPSGTSSKCRHPSAHTASFRPPGLTSLSHPTGSAGHSTAHAGKAPVSERALSARTQHPSQGLWKHTPSGFCLDGWASKKTEPRGGCLPPQWGAHQSPWPCRPPAPTSPPLTSCLPDSHSSHTRCLAFVSDAVTDFPHSSPHWDYSHSSFLICLKGHLFQEAVPATPTHTLLPSVTACCQQRISSHLLVIYLCVHLPHKTTSSAGQDCAPVVPGCTSRTH